MVMTDPIADMLSRVRNATTAFQEEVRMPSSKLKMAIADILKREGYIDDFGVEGGEHGPILKVDLKYGSGRQGAIAGLKRISKPGLRVYAGRDDLPRVLGGLGIAIISTSQGVMTDRQAARARVGGEVLCYVW
jgi:small subunit ribosomal protein S8